MSTSEPAGPDSGTDTAARGTLRYSVPQAARYLNISERAVRKRIDAGSLFAVRDGRAWTVYLEEPASGTSTADDAVPLEPTELTATPSEHRAVPVPEPVAVPSGTVDLAPLADLIADLTRRNERLTESSTMWQIRAMQAEEKLKMLTAGDVPDDEQSTRTEPLVSPPQPPGEERAAQRPSDTLQSAPVVASAKWWEFWKR